MDNTHPEKHLNNDASTKQDDIDGGSNLVPDEGKSESANPFVDHLRQFFGREIPKRFGLQRWDSLLILMVVVLVLAWVLIFGWYRAHQGVLGRPLRVGIVSWPGYAGGLVANNGLYRNTDSEFWKNGNNLLVDFKVIDDNDELVHQFELGGDNGGIDVMWSTVDSLAYQLPEFEKKGIHLRAFMQVDWSQGGDAIVAGQNVKRIGDLKGLKVARSMSASQWLLEHSLKIDTSLTEKEKVAIIQDLSPQTKGSAKAREDFQSGKADAVVLWEPDVYDLTQNEKTKKADAHVLVDTGANMASNLIADVMVARQEFIQDERGRLAIKAFIKGWFKGAEQAKSNPMRAVRVLKQEPRFANRDDDQVRLILRKVSLSTLEDNVRMFGLRGGPGTFEKLFDEVSSLWSLRGYIDKKKRFAAADACDVELLKEIYREIGIAKPAVGCEPSIITKNLPVDFLGKLYLSDEIKRQLDDQDVADFFRDYPNASFCVQASADAGKDPKLLIDTSRAREGAVIDYLVKHYDRRPSEFISDVTFPELATAEKSAGYIRLTVLRRDSETP